jgi:hypothetical protein
MQGSAVIHPLHAQSRCRHSAGPGGPWPGWRRASACVRLVLSRKPAVAPWEHPQWGRRPADVAEVGLAAQLAAPHGGGSPDTGQQARHRRHASGGQDPRGGSPRVVRGSRTQLNGRCVAPGGSKAGPLARVEVGVRDVVDIPKLLLTWFRYQDGTSWGAASRVVHLARKAVPAPAARARRRRGAVCGHARDRHGTAWVLTATAGYRRLGAGRGVARRRRWGR